MAGSTLTDVEQAAQVFNPIALQWAALFTGKTVPTVTTGGSVAERVTGSKIDPLSLVLIVGFLGIGIYLVSRK